MKLHNWNDLKRAKLGPEKADRSRARAEAEVLEANLAELRNATGATQAELAERVGMSQGELSRVEHREDHLVSTLRRYVEALGGELEIHAVVKGKRVRLSV